VTFKEVWPACVQAGANSQVVGQCESKNYIIALISACSLEQRVARVGTISSNGLSRLSSPVPSLSDLHS